MNEIVEYYFIKYIALKIEIVFDNYSGYFLITFSQYITLVDISRLFLTLARVLHNSLSRVISL